MSFSEPTDEDVRYAELEGAFTRVMASDPVAQHGFNTAKSMQMDEVACLKAAIVALSDARARMMAVCNN